jgi:hypothetical protein
LSKYEPLRRYLENQSGGRLPMTFAEVEGVLGFELPPSAKAHATWWSNNPGAHVGVRAWRDAGWRTSQVSVPSERVTFVREEAERLNRDDGETISLRAGDLSLAALKLVNDYRTEEGDVAKAVARGLHEAAIARRRRLLERFPLRGPKSPIDSVDLIREDRDER